MDEPHPTTGYRWDRVEITHIGLVAKPPNPDCTVIALDMANARRVNVAGQPTLEVPATIHLPEEAVGAH